MSKAKHTAGEWTTDDPELYRPDDAVVIYAIDLEDDEYRVEICEVYASPDDGTRDGNVALIAAAPDLLAACEAVRALWAKHGLGDDDSESEPVWAQLNAAIAKAEGK